MNTPEFIANIRRLVAAGEVRTALRHLNDLLANSPKLNEAILLSSRFERIREQTRLGLVLPEYSESEQAQIEASLLDLLGFIEAQTELPAIRKEVEQAISVVNSKNVVTGSPSAGRDVRIGDTTEHHHHYGNRKIPHALTANPFLPEVFLGRETELQEIHERLFSPDGHLLLLVNGKGGIGKTSLASQYYHRYQQEYQHVAWVLSEKSIAYALLLLAQPLGLQFDERSDMKQRLQTLLAELANLHQPCLLVIDNANELEDLETHYPDLRRCSNFHLLLTTRITHFRKAPSYRIEGLPEPEALALFREYYPRLTVEEETGVKAIRIAVNGNTLVLELLAKTLARLNRLKTRYALADLLADLQDKGLLQLAQSDAVHTDYGKLRHATPEEIVAAMYDLSDLPKEEKTLLSVFAVLPAENIPFELLEQLLPDTPELDQHLPLLAQKGWIEYNEAALSFKCSPVVQEIVRHKTPNLRADCEGLVNVLLEKLKYQPGIGHLLNATYEEALLYTRFAEALATRFAESDYTLTLLYERVGNYYTVTGNLNQALASYETYRQISQALLTSEPDNSSFKDRLAISYQYLGNTHTSLGNLKQALTDYEQYNQLEQALYEAYPQNVEFKNGLAISYQNLGNTHTSLGNLKQALTYYEQYHQLEQALYEAYPQHVEFKNNLAISYAKLGKTHTSLGNLKQALTDYEQFNQLEQALYEAYPQNVAFKNNLAISYEKLGTTHTSLGNLKQALTFFEERSSLGKALYEAYPQNVEFKNGLAISYQYLGKTHTSLGNLKQALTDYEQYNQLEQALYEAYPQNVAFKNGLAISYEKLGTTHTSLGNLKQALTFYEQYNQLEQALYEAYPQNVAFKNSLAISYQYLGITHTSLGNLKQALTFYEQYNQLEQALYEAYPQNVGFKNSLALSYQWLGWFHEKQHQDMETAKKFYRLSKELLVELVAQFPDYVEFSKNLDWVAGRLKE